MNIYKRIVLDLPNAKINTLWVFETTEVCMLVQFHYRLRLTSL